MSGGALCPRAGCPGGHSAWGDILPSDTGHVKFGEKSQIIKPAGNHPYYFLERSDHVKQDIRLVGSI